METYDEIERARLSDGLVGMVVISHYSKTTGHKMGSPSLGMSLSFP